MKGTTMTSRSARAAAVIAALVVSGVVGSASVSQPAFGAPRGAFRYCATSRSEVVGNHRFTLNCDAGQILMDGKVIVHNATTMSVASVGFLGYRVGATGPRNGDTRRPGHELMYTVFAVSPNRTAKAVTTESFTGATGVYPLET